MQSIIPCENLNENCCLMFRYVSRFSDRKSVVVVVYENQPEIAAVTKYQQLHRAVFKLAHGQR